MKHCWVSRVQSSIKQYICIHILRKIETIRINQDIKTVHQMPQSLFENFVSTNSHAYEQLHTCNRATTKTIYSRKLIVHVLYNRTEQLRVTHPVSLPGFLQMQSNAKEKNNRRLTKYLI